MTHEPSTQGLHQAAMPSCDAFEQFFQMCREYAQVARLRRETARRKVAKEPPDSTAADTPPLPSPER